MHLRLPLNVRQHAGMSLMIALVLGLSVGSAPAANWQYEGTSGFQLQVYKGGPGNGDEGLWNAVSDHQYFALWSATVDPQGNVYYTAGDIRNVSDGQDPNYPGGSAGVTIMKPDGMGGWTQIDVDLSANTGGLDLRGGITKMVVAGDGKVYALQNWMPIPHGWNWRYFWHLPGADWNTGTCDVCSNLVCRILRINDNGTVDTIVEYSPAEITSPSIEDPKWLNHIKGMDVGPDGNIYWWYAGTAWAAPSSWKEHVLWRYNVTTDTVEESPTAGTNNGWNDISQLVNFAYVGTSASGEMWFAKVRGLGTYHKLWTLNPIGWSTNRTEAVNQQDDSTYGHMYQLHMIWDPLVNRCWVGGWSPPEGTGGAATTSIMTRWNGEPGAPSLFNDELTPDQWYRYGIESVDAWHANGNNALDSGIANNGPYWIAAMALNPDDRSMWVSWGASDTIRWGTYDYNGTYGPFGNVYTIGPADTGPSGNEGNPQTAHADPAKADNLSRTIALTFTDTKVYATTVDLETLEFNLFSADIPDVDTGACCTDGPTCMETTEGVCTALEGVWNGVGSTCGATDCRFKVCGTPFADVDDDGDVDVEDFAYVQACATYDTGVTLKGYPPVKCECFDTDDNDKVDAADIDAFVNCASGANVPAAPDCGN